MIFSLMKSFYILRFTSVTPGYPSGRYLRYTEFQITLDNFPEELWKSKNYQVDFDGTSNSSIQLFSARFKTIDKQLMTFSKFKVPNEMISNLMTNDELNIEVNVVIKYIPIVNLLVPFKNSELDSSTGSKIIIGHFCSMLGDPTFADFKFIVKGKEFKVHKNILAAASPVFLKMFTTDMEESRKGECKIDDFNPETFEEMLRFIYSGKLPENVKDPSIDLLYEIAHFYEIKGLKEMCKLGIKVELSQENALEMFKLACMYDDDLKDLKIAAWNTVKR
jgi:hypothetical protein